MMQTLPFVYSPYYPSSFDLLDKKITNCFLHAEGPGELPGNRVSSSMLGMMVPYGSYDVMGHVCAWAYKQLAESAFPPFFIFLGSSSQDVFTTSLFNHWSTPFGKININKEEGKQLLKQFPSLTNHVDSFQEDSSISTQLPFLQFVNKDYLREISILPLLIGSKDYPSCQDFGEKLAEFAEEKKALIIASYNLYGHSTDKLLVDALKKGDSRKIYDLTAQKRETGHFIVFSEAMKHLFARHNNLLYYTAPYAAMTFCH